MLPARERYDGPAWQVLRSYQRDQPLFATDPDVFVLSAAFGLISASQPIPLYDRLMTAERAAELRPAVQADLRDLLTADYAQLCLALSKRYLDTLTGWQTYTRPQLQVIITAGPPGVKLGQLRAWLYNEPRTSGRAVATRSESMGTPRGHARIAGVTISMAREEVLERARAALAVGAPGAGRYRDWCVLIDGQPVGPKWLISLISGLASTEFEASAARRVLRALGIDVEPVRPVPAPLDRAG